VAANVNQPLYTVEILRLAASIPHLGRLPAPHGKADARSPTCGSEVTVEVTLDSEGRVAELAQGVQACAFGQASAAVMGSSAVGRTAEEVEQALREFGDWLEAKRDDPGVWPGLTALTPARSRRARHGAMLLPFRALLGAIEHAAGRQS
jgi:NifU-like protein involved in Fe-S cluster formation